MTTTSSISFLVAEAKWPTFAHSAIITPDFDLQRDKNKESVRNETSDFGLQLKLKRKSSGEL